MDIKVLSPMIPIIQQYGYIAVIIAVMIEGSSIPFPGTPVLWIVGFIVYKGQMNIWISIFLGAFFYTISSILPYYIGKSLKGRLLTFLEKFCRISKEKFFSMERVFDEYGEVSVCLTRPFFIGNYISYLAGVANINMVRYFILTFIGIIPWVALHMGLGYFFRGNFNKVVVFLEKYNIFIIIALVFMVIGVILWRKKGNKIKDNIAYNLKEFLRRRKHLK